MISFNNQKHTHMWHCVFSGVELNVPAIIHSWFFVILSLARFKFWSSSNALSWLETVLTETNSDLHQICSPL